MKDSDKKKQQLISELAEAHQQIIQLQTAQAKRNQLKNELRESDRRCLAIIEEQTQLISRFKREFSCSNSLRRRAFIKTTIIGMPTAAPAIT